MTQKLGWHNFYEEARVLHMAIRDFLTIPNVGRDKMNLAALKMKKMLEDMILSPGEENPPTKEEEDGLLDEKAAAGEPGLP